MIERQIATIAKWEGRRMLILEQERKKALAVLMARGLASWGDDIEIGTEETEERRGLSVKGRGLWGVSDKYNVQNVRKVYSGMEERGEMTASDEGLRRANERNQKVDNDLRVGVVANPYVAVPL
jgi:hypothetical protein